MDFPMDAHTYAIVATVVAFGSELLALLPGVKSNSWVQLLMRALLAMFPKR